MHYSLSSAQSVFYSDISKTEPTLWNQGVLFEFKGKRSEKELTNAIKTIVIHNDNFHTTYIDSPTGTLLQFVIPDSYDCSIEIFETRDDMVNYINAKIDEPLPMEKSPFRFYIFYYPEHYCVFLHIHHIMSDALCTPELAKQLQMIFNNENEKVSFYSYKDFLRQEQDYRNSPRFSKDRFYWQELLSSGFQTQLFPSSNKIFAYDCDTLIYKFDSRIIEDAKKFCTEHKLLFSSFIYGVFAIYVKRILVIDHFSLGAPVVNRLSRKERSTLGLFMHILPFVFHIEDDTAVIEFLKKINTSYMNLMKHQRYTLEDISRDFGNRIYYDTVVNFQPVLDIGDCEYEFFFGNKLATPLEVHFRDNSNTTVDCLVRYRRSNFSKEDILSFLSSIEAILDSTVRCPEELIRKVSVYPASSPQSLVQGRETSIPDVSLYSLFEEQAILNPDKTCLQMGGKSISFRAFKEKCELLDSHLTNLYPDKKQPIAVLCDRSFEMYTAIYAIIRGGRAYLPVSPDYPVERIRYILQNSLAPILLYQDKYRSIVQKLELDSLICVDVTPFLNSEVSTVDSPLPARAEAYDPAYIIYTSGSTGTPKGVCINNHSAVNRILWMEDNYPLGRNGCILQKTPYTFDVSVWEIFWWGIRGGCLGISAPDEHFLPVKIVRDIKQYSITHLHFVPSVFLHFVEYLEHHPEAITNLDTLQYIFLSGEELKASLVNRFNALLPEGTIKLVNLYGPTECTVDVSYYTCSYSEYDPIPIGLPVDNTSLYILDSYGEIMPIGKEGEICVSGANVGVGYINNPELTQEKFSYHAGLNKRIYHTGDYGYMRDDRQIIYCGRKDSMVKLHGQRIELGEIEAVISSFKMITSCAVLVHSSNRSDILMAFYTGDGIDVAELRDYCKKFLPDYMVPAVFKHLIEMPLNNSGKMDRRKLSDLPLDPDDTIPDRSKVSPASELERHICFLYEQIFQNTSISRDSNFISLGGSSLDAISLLSDHSLSSISPSEFAAHPTPATLASYIEEKNQEKFKTLLYLNGNPLAKRAILIFPYAGGGPEAFFIMSKLLSEKCKDYSIWYVPYPHTEDECQTIQTEIEELSSQCDLYFYSHCVGSSVVLKLWSSFSNRTKKAVKSYFAAASIPVKSVVNYNLWNLVLDQLLSSLLLKAGSDLKNLNKKYKQEKLKAFRDDTDFSTKLMSEPVERISCPTCIIVADRDIFTKHSTNPAKAWRKYASNIYMQKTLHTSSHYFQADEAETLTDLIAAVLNKSS